MNDLCSCRARQAPATRTITQREKIIDIEERLGAIEGRFAGLAESLANDLGAALAALENITIAVARLSAGEKTDG
ncbi:MAG TPA: hypothetical protein PLJ34_07175 [Hyphomicrobiales bacterium]|nr:hypothetical protein [Hyphomicrobiales bacterium]